jgi:hypothetical protein
MRKEYFYNTKYNTRCFETNKLIIRGENILISNGKAYCKDSRKYNEFIEAYGIKHYIEAQENAYFDKFISLNYLKHD